ncbi:MAG: hypothetical protein HY763_00225 [Planctomycetes bacterium]|nr:hypothetical protein [Planctomycetota bacterium]
MPSAIAASAAQAAAQARETAASRESRRAEDVLAAGRQSRAVDEAGTTVDTADADTQVFTDSEGAGSQGRAFDSQPDADAAPAPADSASGVTRDPNGRLHLDLQA